MDEKQLEVLRHTTAHARVLEMILLSLISRLSVGQPTIAQYVMESAQDIASRFGKAGLTLEAAIAADFKATLTGLMDR